MVERVKKNGSMQQNRNWMRFSRLHAVVMLILISAIVPILGTCDIFTYTVFPEYLPYLTGITDLSDHLKGVPVGSYFEIQPVYSVNHVPGGAGAEYIFIVAKPPHPKGTDPNRLLLVLDTDLELRFRAWESDLDPDPLNWPHPAFDWPKMSLSTGEFLIGNVVLNPSATSAALSEDNIGNPVFLDRHSISLFYANSIVTWFYPGSRWIDENGNPTLDLEFRVADEWYLTVGPGYDYTGGIFNAAGFSGDIVFRTVSPGSRQYETAAIGGFPSRAAGGQSTGTRLVMVRDYNRDETVGIHLNVSDPGDLTVESTFRVNGDFDEYYITRSGFVVEDGDGSLIRFDNRGKEDSRYETHGRDTEYRHYGFSVFEKYFYLFDSSSFELHKLRTWW